MTIIRKVIDTDLEQISKIERECFPEPNYPHFFFKQISSLPTDTFQVAEQENGEIAGFCFALKSDIDKETAWILTIAVSKKYQNQKIARQLTKRLLDTLFGDGITSIKLTVRINNYNAIKLYKGLGFVISEIQENYFNDNEPRYIMSFSKKEDKIKEVNYDLLMGEVGISIGFVNVLFAISAIVISIISSSDSIKVNPEKYYVPLIYLFMILFSSLYASIFYANTSGIITRIKRFSEIAKPMRYGNVLSEYYGLFPLTVTIPLLVYAFSNNIFFSAILLSIDLLAFSLYHMSKFDILSRYFKHKIGLPIILLVFIFLTVSQFISEVNGWTYIKYVTVSMMLIYLTILLIIGIKRNEN